MEQPLHISHTAQEITAYSPIIFMPEIRKKFPFYNPLPKPPFWLLRELPHKSQNHLNNFHCPFALHQPSSPDLPALNILLIKYLITAVTWFGKNLYIYIKWNPLKSHALGAVSVTFLCTSGILDGIQRKPQDCNWQWTQLWVSELRSSSSDSLEQALPANKLSNHLMQAVEKSWSSLFFFFFF